MVILPSLIVPLTQASGMKVLSPWNQTLSPSVPIVITVDLGVLSPFLYVSMYWLDLSAAGGVRILSSIILYAMPCSP